MAEQRNLPAVEVEETPRNTSHEDFLAAHRAAKATEQTPRRRAPMDLVGELQAELDQLWGGFPFPSWPLGRRLGRLAQLPAAAVPRADVFEQDDNIVVKAELPGVRKEDVDLAVEDGDLVMRAERREEREVKEENYYRAERQVGALYRRLPLPEGVRADQIRASLSDGVLEVTIPRPAAARSPGQKIPVR